MLLMQGIELIWIVFLLFDPQEEKVQIYIRNIQNSGFLEQIL